MQGTPSGGEDEHYKVTTCYTKRSSGEMDLKVGDVVDVHERNVSGTPQIMYI